MKIKQEKYICSKCGMSGKVIDANHEPPIIHILHESDCNPPRRLVIAEET